MSTPATTLGKGKLVLGLIPITVIAVVLGAYLFISLGQAGGVVGYSNLANNSQSTSSGNGVETIVSMNMTRINSGQGILINIEDYNTLDSYNNLSFASDWLIQSLALGPCGHFNNPIGIAIFQGNYDASNISSATSLNLYEPGVYMCPADIVVQNYSFEPKSDLALVYSPSGSSENTIPISGTASASGFWMGTGVLSNSTFSSFTPGIYTVAGGDEWGQVAFLHFVVA